jgi:uncharacterized protein (TIGR02594 family)
MRFAKSRAAILLCSVALIGLTGSAFAGTTRHHHHHHHRRHAVAAAVPAPSSAGTADHRYAFLRNDWKRRHGRAASSRRHRAATAAAPRSAGGGFSSNALVAEARKYIGTNPTGRKSLWCGAFMDMILRETGHKGGGNLALGYAHYGRRISGPKVGAIAVMGRKGGGHVGVVVGLDANGNPIVVSGNHNHTVAQSVYPRRRIVAYVEPNN